MEGRYPDRQVTSQVTTEGKTDVVVFPIYVGIDLIAAVSARTRGLYLRPVGIGAFGDTRLDAARINAVRRRRRNGKDRNEQSKDQRERTTPTNQ